MKSLISFMAAMAVAAAAQAAPVTYVIDNAHTFPRFGYSHMGYSMQQSRFDKTSGTIILDREARTGRAEIRIDARSVSTGVPALNDVIQTEDFFNTKKYPEILFTSNDFQFDGEKLVALNGQLTIKGVTRPATLNVTSFKCMPNPMDKKDTCGANAVAVLKRSDFNMGKYAPQVSDEVALNIAVEAVRK